MKSLNSQRRGAALGQAKYLVIFVHGYGADGNDLLSLADVLGQHLPQTAFYAPDAPQACAGNQMGFQWFPIPWLDGSSEEAARAGMAQAVEKLRDFIAECQSAEGVGDAQTALIGFSQGTMMSLHVLPRRAQPVAGLVGFSGRLLSPETLSAELTCRPPVLLVHGDQDPMVPYTDMAAAEQALSAAEFEVYTHTSNGTGHGIAPDGLGVALGFLQEKLGLRASD